MNTEGLDMCVDDIMGLVGVHFLLGGGVGEEEVEVGEVKDSNILNTGFHCRECKSYKQFARFDVLQKHMRTVHKMTRDDPLYPKAST